MYISVKVKFVFALLMATLWFALSTWLSLPWLHELGRVINPVAAFLIILFIALLPGFMNAFLLASYFVDKRPTAKDIKEWPNVSVLIAALNEEKYVAETVKSIVEQQYKGKIEIIVVDNGSTDNTLNVLKKLPYPNLIIAEEKQRGKSYASNKGLSLAKYDYLLVVDADTLLLSDAIEQIMTRILSVSPNTAAVAGSVYVKNSRESFMTRLQEWDYFHSIAVVKRMQSLFQGTLVAQGAFSLYRKKVVEEVGGWQPVIGEDIVLTWGMIEKGYRIDFSETALAFTTVPSTYKGFFRQRSRWARGMIEAFISHPKVLLKPRLPVFFIYWDLFFPVIDSVYFFIFIPGIIAAFFGYFYIVGPMTLAVLPIALMLNLVWFVGQRKLFLKHHLHLRKNFVGFIFYFLFFYLIMVPSCIFGYLSELFKMRKRWGTK